MMYIYIPIYIDESEGREVYSNGTNSETTI